MAPANGGADDPLPTGEKSSIGTSLIRRLWLRSRRLSGTTRYAGAAVLAVLACAVRLELSFLWGSTHLYVFAFAITLFTALFAGTGPALVGMLTMTLLTTLWVLEPMGLLAVNTTSTATGLLAFVLVDTALAWLGGQHRHLLAEAEAQREALAGQTSARSRAEERLQTALDAAGMAVWDWDLETGAVERSPNAERVLGVHVAHVDQFLSALHPADRPRFEERVAAVLRGEAKYEIEYRIMGSDGSARWLSDQATLSTSAVTGHRHLAGVCMDVTVRKEAQERLREAYALLDTLRNQAPIGFAYLDRNLRFVSVNRWLAQINGLPESEHIGRTVREVVPSLADQVEAVTAQVLATGETVQNFQMLGATAHEPDRERWWNESWYPVRNESDEITGFGVVMEEITARKLAEQSRQQSEENFRQLANAMPQLVWVADSNGVVTYYNSRALHYAGLQSTEEGVWDWQPVVHPEDLERTVQMWHEAVRTCSTYEIEHRVRVADGSYRWHLSRAFPAQRREGVQWYGTATDVHDIKEAQEELRAARDKAQAANRAKDDFLAALSHELRTPLTPVLLCATVLAEDPALSPEIREDLAMIRRNVALEARLIDDLLDVTRIARGKLELQREHADAHLLLQQAGQIVASDAVQKGVRLRWELHAAKVQIHADPARIQQVFWNLLHNAVKFTDKGGTITVRSSNTAAGRLRIEFTDTGRGIAPEALSRIFRPFDQGELEGAQHRFGGLGLGLAICKAIVETHGGSLCVESAGLGHGTTFSVEMPASLGAAPEPAKNGTNGHRTPAPPGLRLLLVEDHVPTLEALTRLLRRDGHAVQAAQSKAEALELASAHEFDLVLSDLGLPDGSGLELMRSIRERHGWPGVALTGFGAPEDVSSAVASGFNVHLTKPVDLARLRAALGEALVH